MTCICKFGEQKTGKMERGERKEGKWKENGTRRLIRKKGNGKGKEKEKRKREKEEKREKMETRIGPLLESCPSAPDSQVWLYAVGLGYK